MYPHYLYIIYTIYEIMWKCMFFSKIYELVDKSRQFIHTLMLHKSSKTHKFFIYFLDRGKFCFYGKQKYSIHNEIATYE